MSHLIKRFKEDLQLAGYAKRSNQSYVSSVLRLQRFYNKPCNYSGTLPIKRVKVPA